MKDRESYMLQQIFLICEKTLYRSLNAQVYDDKIFVDLDINFFVDVSLQLYVPAIGFKE